jgi:hypothetical protein
MLIHEGERRRDRVDKYGDQGRGRVSCGGHSREVEALCQGEEEEEGAQEEEGHFVLLAYRKVRYVDDRQDLAAPPPPPRVGRIM